MKKDEIEDAISDAFGHLSELNTQVYDYWICKLYDKECAMIDENWNEQNLYEMEKDVMFYTQFD